MKKSLIALAALAASGVAMAQSSVTLYGVLDTGVSYFKGDDSVYGLTKTGGNINSRLGFRGVEDLGNGLKATFDLEAGFNVDDGTGYLGKGGSGLEFRRTSTVGLEGAFGTVRLGRELTAPYRAVGRYDVFNDTGAGASLAWNTRNNGYDPRVDNAITYYTPVFSGFKAGLNYGFGEKQKARDSRYIGAGATYDNGPISVGLGYERQNNANVSIAADRLGVEDPAQLSNLDNTTWQLGASYNFGMAKLAGFYKDTKYKDVASGSSDKFKTFGLGVSAPVGAAGEVRASYNHYKLSDDGGKAQQVSLGYVHNLSKRTALYGTYAYLKNKDGLAFQLNGAMDGARLKNGEKQHGLQLGVRHAF